MAQFKANAEQNVLLNSAIVFDSSIPCPRGNVYHESGSGIFILRGPSCNSCNRFARYQVIFNGNISIPTGGTVAPIAVAITVNGEVESASRSIYTPTAAGAYGNVTSVATIDVPRGLALTMSVRAVDGTTVDGATPAPSINQINGLLDIQRTA